MKIKITGATRKVPKFDVGKVYNTTQRTKDKQQNRAAFLVDAYGGLIEVAKLKDVQIEWEEVNV